jgi:hypothetical protein
VGWNSLIQLGFKPLDAMAQLRVDFRIRSVRPAAVKPLRSTTCHKVEEIVQVKHGLIVHLVGC